MDWILIIQIALYVIGGIIAVRVLADFSLKLSQSDNRATINQIKRELAKEEKQRQRKAAKQQKRRITGFAP